MRRNVSEPRTVSSTTIDQENLSKWRAKRERILNNRPAIWLDVVAVLDGIVTECLSWTTRSVVTETRLFEIVRNHGWPILFESREMFKVLLEANPSLENNALFPLMHVMMDMSFKIDNANTRSIYPTPCPSLEEVVKKCLNYFYHVRFLGEPKIPSSKLKDEEHPKVSIFTRTGRR
ncbi:uncharacterized protein BJ171DRAFT_640089 [Polychytrium aggregatum]|uniref:uncharacterized protein n=1 Tax=Polychytrium aggregatum TaxID=110093 RepID=UPI0022FEC99D|nr:uncharacterized protein BJ171DRAFT_640089 [Polychytrium aggregatum]KAI9207284.1 hypothetical protein BJ171DRAFT_640089 [Polychytrium aggregatum]